MTIHRDTRTRLSHAASIPDQTSEPDRRPAYREQLDDGAVVKTGAPVQAALPGFARNVRAVDQMGGPIQLYRLRVQRIAGAGRGDFSFGLRSSTRGNGVQSGTTRLRTILVYPVVVNSSVIGIEVG
ncbi:hypothetical protein [Aliiroseovarius sediminilitoris]|uniref:hypothetical protein n=1 Tax=Aliiroseovarius sediminilitoris TaxID=1173584 RepID=UPI00115FF2E9|nr:hypothetical protein [Aliiroseovarius sediminilitoris]